MPGGGEESFVDRGGHTEVDDLISARSDIDGSIQATYGSEVIEDGREVHEIWKGVAAAGFQRALEKMTLEEQVEVVDTVRVAISDIIEDRRKSGEKRTSRF